jgi:hypothetical protein
VTHGFIGYPICPTTPALVAGAVFGALLSGSLTLFSCCIIGQPRDVRLQQVLPTGEREYVMVSAGCCGSGLYAMGHSTYSGMTTTIPRN